MDGFGCQDNSKRPRVVRLINFARSREADEHDVGHQQPTTHFSFFSISAINFCTHEMTGVCQTMPFNSGSGAAEVQMVSRREHAHGFFFAGFFFDAGAAFTGSGFGEATRVSSNVERSMRTVASHDGSNGEAPW